MAKAPENIAALQAELDAELTEEQKANKYLTESCKLRYLATTGYDVKKTAAMLADTIKFRADNKIDDLASSPAPRAVEELRNYTNGTWHGFSKAGSPLLIGQWGKIHCIPMSQRIPIKYYTDAHLWHFEQAFGVLAPEEAKRRGAEPSEQVFNIIDFKGLGMDVTKLVPFIQAVAELDKKHYPGRNEKAFMINAPKFFKWMWDMSKAWIEPVSVANTMIFLEKEDYKATLLEYVDADQLPMEYGGTCTSEECKARGSCLRVLPELDWVKFDQEMMDEAKTKMQLKTLTVGSGKKETVDIEITLEDAKSVDGGLEIVPLQVFFQTQKAEIKFHIAYEPLEKGTDAAMSAALEAKVYKSHTTPVMKYLDVPPGRAVLTWENTALMGSKTVTYGVRRLPRNGEEEKPLDSADTAENAALWTPDKHATDCPICSKAFSFFNRKHHCRKCGGLCCGPCSGGRVDIEGVGKNVRICDKCAK